MGSPGASKQYRMEMERRELEARELDERTRLKRAAARHTMALWNAALAAGWRSIFYPSVGTALRTDCHWLHVVCPACQQTGELDLRTVDIHPNASLGTVVRKLSCQRCSPHPPFARPLGATRRSWYGRSHWKLPKRMQVTFRSEDGGPSWAKNQIAGRKKKHRT